MHNSEDLAQCSGDNVPHNTSSRRRFHLLCNFFNRRTTSAELVQPVNDRREPGGGLADENEDIEVIEIAVYDAFAAVDQGAIVDAKTLIALMWFRNRRLQT